MIELDLNMKRIIFIVDIISKTTSFVSHVLVEDLELFVPGMTTRKRMWLDFLFESFGSKPDTLSKSHGPFDQPDWELVLGKNPRTFRSIGDGLIQIKNHRDLNKMLSKLTIICFFHI